MRFLKTSTNWPQKKAGKRPDRCFFPEGATGFDGLKQGMQNLLIGSSYDPSKHLGSFSTGGETLLHVESEGDGPRGFAGECSPEITAEQCPNKRTPPPRATASHPAAASAVSA